MKTLALGLALLFSMGSFASMNSDVLPLADGWKLQSSAKLDAPAGKALSTAGCSTAGWYACSVPRTVLAALVDNNVYPDPYYGTNLKKIPGYKDGPWLRMDESSPFYPTWWYRTEFTAPADFKDKYVRLHLDGINYRANVWLNGERVADDSAVVGMFRRFEFDVTPLIKIGAVNCLAIEISAPGKLPDKQYNTKQLEATTGWDDHNPQPPDLNMGIWQNVYLTATGPVMLRHPHVLSKLDVPSLERAELTVSAQITNVSNEKVEAVVKGVIESTTIEQTVPLAPGESRWLHFDPSQYKQLIVSKPRVWWPHPLGPQELYDLELSASVASQVSDKTATRFGIREATTTVDDTGWRNYWINGQRILIRGGAWMTNDMLLRFSERRDRALVRYAREANLNMLRSEGFSIRETDQLYDICDELGVMVTQQLFGRNIPDEPLAIACIEDTMLRIRNHPSLVHFLGHDETFPTPTLDQAYLDLIAKYTPERTYQPHSGAFEVEGRFKTGGTRTGTRELWTYADPARYYNVAYPERAWGFAQSGGVGGVVATAPSVRRMIPESELWPLWSEAMSFHTVIQGAEFFRETVKAMNARYGEPKDIDDFCRTGQVLNYESARAMYESYARNKYDALGLTAWKYDAAWPAVMTWHYIDWYLAPTGAYYGAKKACEAVHVQYSYDDQSVWVVNSLYKPCADLRVSAKLYNLDMTEKGSKDAVVSVGSDSKTSVFTIEKPDGLSKSYILSLTLTDASGKMISDNVYWLSTVPDTPGKMKDDWRDFTINAASIADHTLLRTLPQVVLETSSEFRKAGDDTTVNVCITNPTDYFAFFVNVVVMKGDERIEVSPCYWTDNDFSLFPGQTKEVQGVFSSQELEGAPPKLYVSGWNVTPSP